MKNKVDLIKRTMDTIDIFIAKGYSVMSIRPTSRFTMKYRCTMRHYKTNRDVSIYFRDIPLEYRNWIRNMKITSEIF